MYLKLIYIFILFNFGIKDKINGLNERLEHHNNPVANPKSVVRINNARFTILTPWIIRMEWNMNNIFRDDATIVFINRYNSNPPKFQVRKNFIKQIIEIETTELLLVYQINSSTSFNDDNLYIQIKNSLHKNSNIYWKPSMNNSYENRLPGTIRTLDGMDGPVPLDCFSQTPEYNRNMHCEYGIINKKEGYTIIDDTNSILFDKNIHWNWIQILKNKNKTLLNQCNNSSSSLKYGLCGLNIVNKEQCTLNGCCYHKILNNNQKHHCYYGPTSYQDLYFFGHGIRYRQAMKDFILLSGKIPLLPRYSYGSFFSRYWAFTDSELRQDVIKKYNDHKVPLDIVVLDMDWHLTYYLNNTKDQAGQPKGWTGFTWNKNLFPNPKEFIKYCHLKGIMITLNLHPASGIQPWEDTYIKMAKIMNITKGKYIPLNLTNKIFVENWLNITIGARESEGIDFWWLDWQQGEEWLQLNNNIYNLNPTLWLNYIFFTNPNFWNKNKQNKRPFLLHRWGGLGNHRYQGGFSGDVKVTWNSLKFQPYFTSMSANVAYGYWSHDLGGHASASPPELFTRWIQWGIFSPIFRTHCTKDARSDRRIWKYNDDYYEIMRDAILLRISLIPYIYTESRKVYDTGVSLLYSLYFDFPENEESYIFIEQYMFGDYLLIRPITSPISNITKLSHIEIWLPKGNWYDFNMGRIYSLNKGRIFDLNYTLNEIPYFGKSGTILTMDGTIDSTTNVLGKAKKLPKRLHLIVLPGLNTGYGHLYEDDGIKNDYYNNKNIAWTYYNYTITYNNTKIYTLRKTNLIINPTNGSFNGILSKRKYIIEFLQYLPPFDSIYINNIIISKCNINQINTFNCWKYNGKKLSLKIFINKKQSIYSFIKIIIIQKIIHSFELNDYLLYGNGFPGKIKRLHLVKKLLDNQWNIHTIYMGSYKKLIELCETDTRITYNPNSTMNELNKFNTLLPDVIKEILNLNSLPDSIRQQCIAFLTFDNNNNNNNKNSIYNEINNFVALE